MSANVATEETLVIETPGRVPLHFALASIGNRFLACAIDHTIQLLVLLVVALSGLIVANFASWGDWIASAPKWVFAAMIVVVFLILAGYFAFFEWIWSGQTPGKRWMKLRVLREDGRPITFWEASVRNLLRTLDMMPVPFYSIGLISVFARPVSDPALRRSFKPVSFTASLNSLTDSEIQVVETFLRRRWDLPDVPRQWMAWRVSLPILYKLRPTYDLATFTYEGFLEELLHRYLQQHRFGSRSEE